MDVRRERSERLRELISHPEGCLTIGVRDAWPAKLLERKGLKSVYLGGFSVAAARGQLDRKIYPSDWMILMGRIVTNAVDIPVMVDMDEGGGGVLEIRENFKNLLETTRAAGAHMEDQVPGQKRCGQHGGKAIFDLETATKRMQCAIDMIREIRPEFVFMARTDAFVAAGYKNDPKAGGDIEEVIKRGVAFAGVGADIVWCEFPRTDLFYAFEAFAKGVHKEHPGLPLGINISPSNRWHAGSVNRKQLNDMGYRFLFCTYGALLAETAGVLTFADDFMHNPTFALAGLQERMRLFPELARFEPHSVVNGILGIEDATALEERYDPTAAERFATSHGHR